MPILLHPLVGKQRCKCIEFVSVLKTCGSSEAVQIGEKIAAMQLLLLCCLQSHILHFTLSHQTTNPIQSYRGLPTSGHIK